MDVGNAEAKNRIVQKFYWKLRQKRPARLDTFAAEVLTKCSKLKPRVVLTTGSRVPLLGVHIRALRRRGIKVVNFSTDDPWNPVLCSPWFIATIPDYDAIFTPRRSNLSDFDRCGARETHYLPFAYDPKIHQSWPSAAPPAPESDLIFVGGCDPDRLPLISALVNAGLNPALFGGYWNRHSITAPFARGLASQDSIRAYTAGAAIALCLVRRANRDSHVMRSYEAAAIGGCILAEDTPDHRELFGADNVAAKYFSTADELVSGALELLRNDAQRAEMSTQLSERMAHRQDTYASRLTTLLNTVLEKSGGMPRTDEMMDRGWRADAARAI